MDDWWRQYQGFFVLGAFIALLVLGGWARARSRRFVARAADNAANGRTLDQSGYPVVERAIASLATVVRIPLALDAAAALVAGASLPRWWKRADDHRWVIPTSRTDPTPETIAVLEPEPEPDGGGGTSVLRLVAAADMGGLPTSEPDWRKLRRAVLAAAETAGVSATEEAGPRLVRTPQTDVAGLSHAQVAVVAHRWEAPAR